MKCGNLEIRGALEAIVQQMNLNVKAILAVTALTKLSLNAES